jgi:hypothetical protein
MMTHVCLKHKAKASQFNDSYFLKQVRLERQNKKRETRKRNKAKPVSSSEDDDEDGETRTRNPKKKDQQSPSEDNDEEDEDEASDDDSNDPEASDDEDEASDDGSEEDDEPNDERDKEGDHKAVSAAPTASSAFKTSGTDELLAKLEAKASAELDSDAPNMERITKLFDLARSLREQTHAAPPCTSLAGPSSPPSIGATAKASTSSSPKTGQQQQLRVSIREEASAFKSFSKKELDAMGGRRVYKWPLEKDCGLEFEGLWEFMVSRTKAKGNSSTAKDYYQGCHYFFAQFKVEGPRLPLLDVFKELYSTGTISKAMVLQLWDPSVSWASKMYAGMNLCSDFLGIKAEDNNDEKAMLMSESFRKRFIVPLGKQLPAGKGSRGERRKQIDKARRHELPSVEQQGEAVNWMLIDLDIICDGAIDLFMKSGSLPEPIRRVVNANTLGVYAWRTYPGRPCEIESFPLDRMNAFLADPDAWFVLISAADHKTGDTCGDMGRLIPPELRSRLEKVARFGCKERNLLFVPARKDTSCISVNKAAKDSASVYTPGRQHPEPTLLRKSIETEIALNTEKAAAMNDIIPSAIKAAKETQETAARMAAHQLTTAKKHYILESGDPVADAWCSHAYIHVFKGLLPPLTEAQEAAKKSRTTDDILKDFATMASRGKRGEKDKGDTVASKVDGTDSTPDTAKGEDAKRVGAKPAGPKSSGSKIAEGSLGDIRTFAQPVSFPTSLATDEETPPPSARFHAFNAVLPDDEFALKRLLDKATLKEAMSGKKDKTDKKEKKKGKAATKKDEHGVKKKDKNDKADKKEDKKGKKEKKDKKDKKEKKDKTGADDDKSVLTNYDTIIIWKHGALARGENKLLDSEKEYIVKELRNLQEGLTPQYMPNKAEISKIITSGMEGGLLFDETLEEKAYFEKVRQFVRMFLKLASADGPDDKD